VSGFQRIGQNWIAYNGDCVSVASQLADESVGFSIYSPPFQNIFTYSDSELDMGNCSSDEEFAAHYQFLVKQIFRLTQPGRLTAVHCSDLPSSKWKDGVIGLKDFPADIVRAHQAEGWIFHSRICIWRDPVVEMTRTKALGLLYKQLKKDSTRSRMGLADYVLVFRKPGDNIEPVEQRRRTSRSRNGRNGPRRSGWISTRPTRSTSAWQRTAPTSGIFARCNWI
jgi:hypothetical protein